MKAIKFRICNYKSIIDSGYCDLASDITIFIGKNESGKTAALEALRDFDRDIAVFPQNAYPLDQYDASPMVEVLFETSADDLEFIQSASGISLPKEFNEFILRNGLSIIKNGQKQYRFKEQFLSELLNEKSADKNNDPLSLIKNTKDRLTSLINDRTLPELDVTSSPLEIKRNAKEFMTIIKSMLPSFADENKKTEIVEAIRVIIQESNKLTEVNLTAEDKVLAAVAQRMPRFIYFSEFVSNFPFDVPLTKIKETQSIIDFAKISGLDLNKFVNTEDTQKRINILNRHCAIINNEFGDFWQQNQVELVIKPEGDKILFGVKERDKTDIFKIEQRSKGFQWFLSFFLRLNTQKSKDHIILIDEPGTHLHAKAQGEILKVLEKKITPETPVILSTHSPYLINPLRLDRLRPLIKSPQTGSVIHNHITTNLDAQTMTPVNTALGIDAAGALPLPGKKNIIITDLADFYLFTSMQKFMEIPGDKEINFLPCPDDQHLDMLISLLKGFGYELKIIFNRREENAGKGKQLQETFGLRDDEIIYIPLADGTTAIDLFSQDDFYSRLLEKNAIPNKALSPSQFLEDNNIDAALLGKKLGERNENSDLKLSAESLAAFQEIFDRIISGQPAAPEVIEEAVEEIKETIPVAPVQEIKEETPPPVEPEKKKRWFFAEK